MALGRRVLMQQVSWRKPQVRAQIRPLFVWLASYVGGRHESQVRCFGLFWLGRRGLSQPLCWRIRIVSALVWHLLLRSAWVQPATVLVDTTGEGPRLAFFSLGRRGLSQPLCWRSRQEKPCSGLCLLVRRGLGQVLCWRAQQVMALL
jgi:hypothetical protein